VDARHKAGYDERESLRDKNCMTAERASAPARGLYGNAYLLLALA